MTKDSLSYVQNNKNVKHPSSLNIICISPSCLTQAVERLTFNRQGHRKGRGPRFKS